MVIKLSCKNCKYTWKVVSEDKIPRTCPYCDKGTVDWNMGEVGFTDVDAMLK